MGKLSCSHLLLLHNTFSLSTFVATNENEIKNSKKIKSKTVFILFGSDKLATKKQSYEIAEGQTL